MLICDYNDMRGSYVARRLVQEAERAGSALACVGVADTLMLPDGTLYNAGRSAAMGATDNAGRSPLAADYAIVRVKEGRARDLLAQGCGRCYNELSAFSRFVDKYEQLKALADGVLALPGYVLATSETPFDQLAERLGVPFVAKGLRSSQGREVELIRSPDDLRAFGGRLGRGRELLFESYVATSHGRDVRLFVLRGQVLCGMQRTSNAGFQANYARGAKLCRLDITQEMAAIALAVYERTSLDYCGLDLLYGSDGLVFCEVNVMPGIEGMERATGVNVAASLVDMIVGDLS
jgi:RimK family alpha-L-glutamate ligase